jgi:hypothetical protein
MAFHWQSTHYADVTFQTMLCAQHLPMTIVARSHSVHNIIMIINGDYVDRRWCNLVCLYAVKCCRYSGCIWMLLNFRGAFELHEGHFLYRSVIQHIEPSQRLINSTVGCGRHWNFESSSCRSRRETASSFITIIIVCAQAYEVPFP